jgi:hypothetical protein
MWENTALKMSSRKEAVVGEQQHEIQPIKIEGCAPLKLEAE